jgi:hypothetical protein
VPLRQAFRLAVVAMAVVSLAAAGLLVATHSRESDAQDLLARATVSPDRCLGAASLERGSGCAETRTGPVVPDPLIAGQDRTRLYGDGCWENPPFAGTASCTYGDPSAPVSIALVGHSHAGHWFAAVQALASERHARVTTFLAAGCTVTTARLTWETEERADGCLAWGRRVVKETSSGRYDLIVTSEIATRGVAGGSASNRQKDLEKGYLGVLRAWDAKGKHVLVIRDSPRVPELLGTGPQCVAANPSNLRVCSGDWRRWVYPDALVAAARSTKSERIAVVDLTPRFCSSRCSAVVGGVLAFYDNHHMTETFVRTLVPYLRGPLFEALDQALRDRTQEQAD